MTLRTPDTEGLSALSAHNVAQLEEAWVAWEKHGTTAKAAEALGITAGCLRSRIQRYRKVFGKRPKPANGKRTEQRTRLAYDAWAAWEEHGSVALAAASRGLTYSGFRGRLENYWDMHGMRHGIAPKSLRTWDQRQAEAAWKAWEEHGTHAKAGEALGVSTYTISQRVSLYRRIHKLPSTARPSGPAVNCRCHQ